MTEDEEFENAITKELLALPVCKTIVATFAGMGDLSAFNSAPEKLGNLVTAMGKATEVPESLSGYSLDHVHHAAEMVRWCVLKDQNSFDSSDAEADDLLKEILGMDVGDVELDLDDDFDLASGD